MTSPAHRALLPTSALLLAVALLAAGCARSAPESHASAVESAACRQHADAVYQLRNPDEVFRADTYATSIRDTPFTGAGLSSVPSAGLSDQFQRDQFFSDCLNGGNGTVGAAPAAPPPEEGPAVSAAPAPAPAQP
jgi:hypothetical protein